MNMLRSQLSLGNIRPPSGIPTDISDFWSTVINVFQIIFSLAGVVAVGIIIFSGYRMMTSSGDPQKMKDAQGSLVNAIIGLVVTLASAVVVTFIANKLGVSSIFDLEIPFR